MDESIDILNVFRAPERDQASFRDVLKLLEPYGRSLLMLVFMTLIISLWTGASQVALTPLAEIVLSGDEVTAQVEGGEVVACELDLNVLGRCVLSITSRLTGITDTWTLLVMVSTAYLVVVVAGKALTVAVRYWGESVRAQINREVGDKVFGRLLRLPLSFLNQYPVGWLQSRMTKDIDETTQTLNLFIIDGLTNLLVSIFYIILLVRTDPRLTLIAALAGGMHMLFSRRMAIWLRKAIIADLGSTAMVQASIQERLGAIREVKALAAERFEQNRMYTLLSEWADSLLKHQMAIRIENPVRWSINRVVMIIVLVVGAWGVLNGRLTTAAFAQYLVFAQLLFTPLAKLAGILVGVTAVRTSLSEVMFILSQEEERAGTQPITAFQDAITLEAVSFSYVDDLPVLQDITLTIKKGEMVALVGRSGAGKTSLVDLILRFYKPTQGSIRVDGTPLDDIELESYRRLFGVVSQDSTLLNDTAANNISYARDLSQEDVERASRMANAHDFITKDLNKGYATELGERGVLLSGGQRQRVAIARALAHRPQILVLDEATSALDSESERLVQQAIDRVAQDTTMIVIAHRLSTVRQADQIVVLHAGRIVERGTHDELLALGGEYAHLYQQQFAEVVSPLPAPEQP